MHATSRNTQTQQRQMIWSIFARFLFFAQMQPLQTHKRQWPMRPDWERRQASWSKSKKDTHTHTHTRHQTQTHTYTHDNKHTHDYEHALTHDNKRTLKHCNKRTGTSKSQAHTFSVLAVPCVTSLSHCKGGAGVGSKVWKILSLKVDNKQKYCGAPKIPKSSPSQV